MSHQRLIFYCFLEVVIMKIALPYDRGRIDQHFGHCQYFEIYTTDGDKILGKMVVPTKGSGHEHITSFLHKMKVDVVIVGHMGKPAILALNGYNIRSYMGLSGSTEGAVARLLEGELEYFNTRNLDLSQMEDHCDHEH